MRLYFTANGISIYLNIYLSIHTPIYLSIPPPIYLSIPPPIYLSIKIHSPFLGEYRVRVVRHVPAGRVRGYLPDGRHLLRRQRLPLHARQALNWWRCRFRHKFETIKHKLKAYLESFNHIHLRYNITEALCYVNFSSKIHCKSKALTVINLNIM